MHVQEMKGVVAALVTPFDDHGQVNEESLRRIVRHILGLGAVGFYVCGSTGEGFSLSTEERRRVIETVKDEVGDRAGLIVNISHMEYRVVLELAAHARACGADAVSTLPPIYHPVGPEEVRGYYLSLLDKVELPLTIYNIPMLSGRTLDQPMVESLVEHPKFVGIKHTSEDSDLLDRFKRAGNGRLVIWSARDSYYLSSLSMGADGAIGSTYNLNADVTNQITAAFRKGDLPRAREIQNRFNIYRDQLFRLGLYQSIKRCFTLMGIDSGGCRSPYMPLGPEADGHVRDVLAMLADLRRYCGLPAPDDPSA